LEGYFDVHPLEKSILSVELISAMAVLFHEGTAQSENPRPSGAWTGHPRERRIVRLDNIRYNKYYWVV
jgi:hypothetical protein